MNQEPTAQSQPPMPAEDVVTSMEEGRPLKAWSGQRGYSDSVVPHVHAAAETEPGVLRHASTTLEATPCSCGEVLNIAPDRLGNSPQPSTRVKARSNLQLPPFQSLGIAGPPPRALLTPPDEATLFDIPPPSITPGHMLRSSSYPPDKPPKSSEVRELSPASNTRISHLASTAPHAHSMAVLPSEETPKAEDSMASEGSESGSSIVPDREAWLSEAVDVVISNATQDTTHRMIYVLCHSQPCPIADDGSKPTVFNDLMVQLQNLINPNSQYIDITHVVPSRFSMAQLPNSPTATPNRSSTGSAPSDYFSINIFPKAVVLRDHETAMRSSVPSSPHPLVVPDSMHISILERYLPPPSVHEYTDLFCTDAPSVLVDRLFELSPQGGVLLFIYPTLAGATSFASTYLGPLLDPLLRSMVGIHALSADIGASVGKMSAVDHMLPYDNTVRKIQLLLRQLSRGVASTTTTAAPPGHHHHQHHPRPAAPKLTLIHTSRETVPLERATWLEWWIAQEQARVRAAMDRYFARGYRLPLGKDVTAGALSREILDGLASRTYAEYDAPREGVEVGVFVIRRTG